MVARGEGQGVEAITDAETIRDGSTSGNGPKGGKAIAVMT
jgi:hypothetical protein